MAAAAKFGAASWTRFGTPLALVALLAIVAGVVLPQLAPAEAPAAPSKDESKGKGDLRYTPPTWPEPPSYGAMFLRLGLGTTLVLGLCVATLWGGKRWLAKLAPAPRTTGEMKLVESLPLGNRCALHLVQIASKQILVGADASGIRTVVPLSEAFEAVLNETQPEEPAAPVRIAA